MSEVKEREEGRERKGERERKRERKRRERQTETEKWKEGCFSDFVEHYLYDNFLTCVKILFRYRRL